MTSFVQASIEVPCTQYSDEHDGPSTQDSISIVSLKEVQSDSNGPSPRDSISPAPSTESREGTFTQDSISTAPSSVSQEDSDEPFTQDSISTVPDSPLILESGSASSKRRLENELYQRQSKFKHKLAQVIQSSSQDFLCIGTGHPLGLAGCYSGEILLGTQYIGKTSLNRKLRSRIRLQVRNDTCSITEILTLEDLIVSCRQKRAEIIEFLRPDGVPFVWHDGSKISLRKILLCLMAGIKAYKSGRYGAGKGNLLAVIICKFNKKVKWK